MLEIEDIVYNPPGEDKDKEWFSLKNVSNFPLKISKGKNGWLIFDGKNHYFKEEITILPGEKIFVVQDKQIFLKNYPQYKNFKITEANFNLKNSGGLLKIFDNKKNLIVEKRWPDWQEILFPNEITSKWIEFKYRGKEHFVLEFNGKKFEVKNSFLLLPLENFLPSKKINLKIENQIVSYELPEENFNFNGSLAKFNNRWLKTSIPTPLEENIYFLPLEKKIQNSADKFWGVNLLFTLVVLLFLIFKFLKLLK